MRCVLFLCAMLLGGAGLPQLPRAVTDADYATLDMRQVRLGQMLFYDPILSGNRNISCATCHHPRFATGDGLALGLGEGGVGLGPDRRGAPDTPPEHRIPRNAPALFNLGATEFTRLFHDGRIELDPAKPDGIRTPMGTEMSMGFANLLSAQTMFPVLSSDEMAGQFSENDVAKAVRQGRITGPGGAWDKLAARVRDTPWYAPLLIAAFPEADEIGFTHLSDAIAAFVAFEWRSDTSAFDAYLRGAVTLEPLEAEGMDLFYGRAGCGSCHAGPFQTDHDFHAMGVPQFGPGKAAAFETHVRDEGRTRVTGRAQDAYAFRTPSLRNVTETAPYGHTGSHADLAGFIADHADPVAGLARFDRAAVFLPDVDGADDWRHLESAEDQAALRAAITVAPVDLSPADIAALVAFLGTLRDPQALSGRLGIPRALPSGLPLDR